jgi:photosystem II stability/assembly factor-like uncharacterized protein
MRSIRSSLVAALAVSAVAPAVRGVEMRHFDDAPLRAVQFVDAKEGWAAGDDGVVWHTIDGGKDWERQSTGVRASLRSIHFLNAYVGWIAGREELPGGKSDGVVLFTNDGGARWQRLLAGSLPGLNVVRFVDDTTGYLAGDGSDQYPSGAFVTRDGGKSWSLVPGLRCPSWLAGAVGDNGAALAGAWSRLAVLKPDRVSPADVEALAGRGLRGACFQGKRGVVVGQGGVVLLNGGSSVNDWSYAENTGLSLEVRQNWDFHAVHGVGGHFWAVGRPGSAVLHSHDQGEHWEVQYTRQPLPLNGIFFLNERVGWAVGELGVILATVDGGKNWKVQRRGGERAAVLFIHARSAGVPLDTVALLGGQEGYLTAGLRVIAPDSASAAPARCGEGDRLAAAWRQAGGAASEMLWQFPLPSHAVRSSRDDMLRAWDQMQGGKAAESLLRQMVLALRMWQPDVVITDCPDVIATGFGCDGMVSEAVREAFRRVSNRKAFPEHANFLGLEPWQPRKVYARWEGRADAEVKIDLTAVRGPLRATLQEFASAPAGLLAEGAMQVPATRNFRYLGGVAGTQNDTDLMQGIDLMPGGVARRPAADRGEPSAEEADAIRRRALVRALADTPPSGLNSPERLLGQMGTMLGDMPDDMAARAAFAVAGRFNRNGQWGLAGEAYLLMVERYPAHPLTAEACRWLIRHHTSSEAKHRQELGHFVVVSDLAQGQRGVGYQQVRQLDPLVKTAPKAQMPQIEDHHTENVFVSQAQPRQWFSAALELEKKLATFGPVFANDPATQFCLQAARRQLGDVLKAKEWYAQFVARQPDGPWRDAALAELWLLNRSGPAPKPLASCTYTDTKPFLDGKLDDECWRNAPVHRLWAAAGDGRKAPPPEDRVVSADTFQKYPTPTEVQAFLKDYPTEVRLAHDQEYLYIAVRCFHPPEKRLPLTGNRTRDGDLRAFDRVSILLDLDRDYSTCFHLQIDQRGCVAEDCWGDKTWDPRWFVAVQAEPTVWVAEAAIPLTALTGDTAVTGRVWAFNAIRVLPGRGVQAWSLPADVPEDAARPEGMGLLMFMKEQAEADRGQKAPMSRAE